MNYTIQCPDHASGKVGCFTYDHERYRRDGFFTATSPVFPHVGELFLWAKNNSIVLTNNQMDEYFASLK